MMVVDSFRLIEEGLVGKSTMNVAVLPLRRFFIV